MCGILGIWAKNNQGVGQLEKLPNALIRQNHRGPDFSAYKLYSKQGLGHNRLAIIDRSESANQPFVDESGDYCLVFNGEIYNYKELRADLESEGVQFRSQSDTEVLFQLLIKHGADALPMLNGCFAFVFFDERSNEMLVARDRMGIKPLMYYEDEDKMIFCSEMSALFEFDIDRTLDEQALNHYFSLTYTPGSETLLEKAHRVLPGQYIKISAYYGLSFGNFYDPVKQRIEKDYLNNKSRLKELLSDAVNSRLIADVPVGSFLSGGLDSSIISALAKESKNDLETYSIGFENEYFDEHEFAEEVARHIGSKHHTFMLGKSDFEKNTEAFFDSLDEPFADSSAFAMYLLSKRTSEGVTVCLSGDGADELFAGYRKHRAELEIREMKGLKEWSIKRFASLLGSQEKSRSNKWGDFNRKLQKFRDGMRLDPDVRYWEWSCFIGDQDRHHLLKKPIYQGLNIFAGETFEDLNDVLMADQSMVLPNDMLKKVDLMSMSQSLEVRTPFLDHRLVEFANSLPVHHKMDKKSSKRILRDVFADYLPERVLKRGKKGFEIPIREWLGDELEKQFNTEKFSREYLEKQGVFNPEYVAELKIAWNDPRFGDKIYLVWALLVFQHWWDRYIKQ